MNTKQIIQSIVIFAVSGCLLFAATKPEDEAQKSAEQWLSLIDTGKFAEGWNVAAAYLQSAVTQEQFVHSLTAVRKPLGDLVSRKLKSAKYTKSLPGVPDGEYVILQFDTSFVNKKAAIETVTPMLDKNGQWKVSGYYIK